MAFVPPLKRMGPPLRLPRLLASLPNLGELSVVKPANCQHPSRVFLITRTNIRYSARKPAPKALEEAIAAQKSGAKVAATQVASGSKSTEWIEGGAMDDEGKIVAHGKAWGLEFVDGKLKTHRSKSKLPDPRIRDANSVNWIAIAPGNLPQSTREAVQSWETIRDQAMQERAEYIKGVQDRAHQASRVIRRKNVKIQRKIDAHMEEIKKVKIVY